MLREYIETRYKTNKATHEELEKQIHVLQEEWQAATEALKELQKAQDIEKSIFSPRSQLGGTPEKLAEIRTKLTEIEKQLEAAGTKQQAVQKEEQEMEQLLTEVLELQHAPDKQAVAVKTEKDEALKKVLVTVESIDTEKEPAMVAEQREHIEPEKEAESETQNENLDNTANVAEIQMKNLNVAEQVDAEATEEIKKEEESGGKETLLEMPEKADEAEAIKPEKSETTSEKPERSDEIKRVSGEIEKRSEKIDTNEERISEETDGRDKEVDSVMTQQDMSAADTESGATEVAGDTETNAVMPENKEAGEEKPEQMLDMERLNDLLSDVYRKAEFCTAFLYSDKNKCRTLLKEMKKELKKYAEEIATR